MRCKFGWLGLLLVLLSATAGQAADLGGSAQFASTVHVDCHDRR